MNKIIQSSLCKGLRACGIPKEQSLQIENIVLKWERESGTEWTNSRIKDLRQWYETCLAGHPQPPSWFRHSANGYPTGIWGWVFNLKPAKALGVLSLNTVFYEDKVSETQKKKFLKGLAGSDLSSVSPEFRSISSTAQACLRKGGIRTNVKEMPKIQFPTLFDMNGSVPVHESRITRHPPRSKKSSKKKEFILPDQYQERSLADALKVLRESWEDVPQVTFDFLVKQNLEGYMPQDVLGNPYQVEYEREHSHCVGKVSVIQNPQLKARIVGNPNRITQVTLEPLKTVLMDIVRKLPNDVTHDQESGVKWVQSKLAQGITLAGSDLTSASDLLDLERSLKLVETVYGLCNIKGYQEYRDYFYEVSRSPWYCDFLNQEVTWKQGDVLGTGPSFPYLTLTNCAVAYCAALQSVDDGKLPTDVRLSDCFRVVGDDIIMDARIADRYNQFITEIGGEVNHSKTLTSDRVAEFAGKIITKNACYLKAIKYREPSDNSFMSLMSNLGDQAKYLLKPKQRQVYETLKEVPGIVVPGPWMPDSYGIGLGLRYQWYLEEVQPVLDRIEPDLLQQDYSMVLLQAQLDLAEADQTLDDYIHSMDEPLLDEGYLPSSVTPTFKRSGDPRLTNGKSMLDNLYVKIQDITPFSEWNRKRLEKLALTEQSLSSSPQYVEEELDEDLDR